MTLQISSPAFDEGGDIPVRFTCEGEDLSPPLAWEGVPADTRSLVLLVEDPDAPDPAAPRMTWVHWVVYNLPPDSRGLPEDASRIGLPGPAAEGTNDWKRTRYGGPCPPIGEHRYFHKLYALDSELTGPSKPSRPDVLAAMQGHILAEATLVGTYRKQR
jgi:Raf kinase inhibitor-like YbhB/YbcL family protein